MFYMRYRKLYIGEIVLKFTIITVCYNAKNKIRETIESVCAQTYQGIEYLIMDGASTDGTYEIAQKYLIFKKLKIYREKDFGIYNAMNRGIARASGDYIIFLNAGDTFYDKYVLEKIYQYMKEDKESIYYGKCCSIFPDGSKKIEDFSKGKGTLEEKLSNGIMPCHQCIFAPRRLLINHYFREQYKIRADYEWLFYSVTKGNVCKSVPVIVCNYDTTGVSGESENSKLFLYEEKQILYEYQGKYEQTMIHCADSDKALMEWKILAQKHLFMFQIMNRWMELKQKDIHIGEYLQKKGYQHIAIYGMSFIGRRLYEELSKNLVIEYAIDQNAENICTDIYICLPNDDLKEVDAIIVTAVMCFNEVKGMLHKKIKSPVLSIENIIDEIFEQENGYKNQF